MGGSAHIPLSEFMHFVELYRLANWHARELWEDVRLIDSLTLEARAEAKAAKQTKK